MVADCLFCKIVSGEIPADVVYTDDSVIAFNDITPKAPVHVLVVPREHTPDIRSLAADPAASAAVIAGVAGVADKLDLSYFTTVFNTGAESGQSVFHVHAHVLSGSGQVWAHGG